jgi:hypothetical protein
MHPSRVRRTDRARPRIAVGFRASSPGFWLALLAALLTLSGRPAPAAESGDVRIQPSICSASPESLVHVGDAAPIDGGGSDARRHAHCDFCASQVSPFGFDRPRADGQNPLSGLVLRIAPGDRNPGSPPTFWAAARSRAPPMPAG